MAVDPVETFRSWEPDSLKKVRRRLLRARDLSCARAMSTPSPAAREIFWIANELAAVWAFSNAPEAKLRDVRCALLDLVLAAGWIENAEAGDDS